GPVNVEAHPIGGRDQMILGAIAQRDTIDRQQGRNVFMHTAKPSNCQEMDAARPRGGREPRQLPASMAGPGKNSSLTLSGRFLIDLMSCMKWAYFMTFSGLAVYLMPGSFSSSVISARSPLPPIEAISTLAAASLSSLIICCASCNAATKAAYTLGF